METKIWIKITHILTYIRTLVWIASFSFKSQDGVRIVTRLGIDDREIVVRLPARTKVFLLLPKFSATLWGPASPLFNGYQVKRLRLGPSTHVHLVPRLKNKWSYTCVPQIRHLFQGDINLYQTFKTSWLIYLPHWAHTVYLCIQYDSDKKYPFPAYRIHRLIFLIEAKCVLCEVKK